MADHYLDKNGLAYYDGVIKQRFEDAANQAGKSLYYIFGTEIPETYNEATFTATNDFTGDTYTGTIVKENLQIQISVPGYYTVSNTADEKTWSILVGDFDSDEIDWEGDGAKRGIGAGGSGSDTPGPSPSETINATITVTVPQELVGETIEARLEDGTSFEQTAASTEVEITVTKKGNYTVRVKDNDYIKTTTNVTEGTSYYATLSVSDDSVPSITVTVANELIGENIIVQGNTYRKTKAATTTTVKFYVNALENFTVSCQNYPSIKQTVNVEEAKNYTTSLQVDTESNAVLVVKVGQDLDGKQVTVKKDAYSYTKTLTNKTATFILPETGIWTISSTEAPDKDRTVTITEKKKYTVNFPAAVFTIKISHSEEDPDSRVTYQDDAESMSPITVDGTSVNYGDWRDTFFFQLIKPCMLKTDGTVDYYLNEENHTQKAEGGASEIGQTSYDGNAMVEIKKLYTRFWSDSDNEYISVTDAPKSGYDCLAFKRSDSTEMDQIYMAMYKGSNNQNKLRSLSGQTVACPGTQQTSQFGYDTYATANGSDYGLCTYAQYSVMNAIFMIMFKSTNAEKLGKGRKSGSTENSSSTGTTPSLTTGILNTSGPIAVDTATGCVKFMYIEDFFFDRSQPLAEQLDGLIIEQTGSNAGKIYVKAQRPYAKDTSSSAASTSGYAQIAEGVTTGGNIKSCSVSNSYGRVPTSVGGTSTTYDCDPVLYDQYGTPIHRGCRRGGISGLASSFFGSHYGSYVRPSCCASLSYEPPAAA